MEKLKHISTFNIAIDLQILYVISIFDRNVTQYRITAIIYNFICGIKVKMDRDNGSKFNRPRSVIMFVKNFIWPSIYKNNCETFAISWVSIARPRFFVKGFDKFSERLRLFFPFSVAGERVVRWKKTKRPSETRRSAGEQKAKGNVPSVGEQKAKGNVPSVERTKRQRERALDGKNKRLIQTSPRWKEQKG